MNKETKNKLSEILNSVKDPENGMSVTEMNLVAGIKLNETTNEFEVFMYAPETAKACCVVYQLNAYSTIEKLLKDKIEKEFPNNKVVFKNP